MKRFLNISLIIGVVVLGFVFGRMTGNGVLPGGGSAQKDYPLPPPPPQPSSVAEQMDTITEHKLVVETPAEGGLVTNSFLVTGRADAVIRKVTIEVLNQDQQDVFASSTDLRDAADGFARFSIDGAVNIFDTADLPETPERLVLLITGLDKGGMKVETIERHLLYGKGNTIPVALQFQNVGKDPSADACSTTYSVSRSLPSDTNVYRSAVEALLAGPTAAEVKAGYSTSIPAKVVLKDIGADANGVVTANFDGTLDRRVAGSCRVGAIRNQIVRTLSQFPEVHGVVIEVDGDSKKALQP